MYEELRDDDGGKGNEMPPAREENQEKREKQKDKFPQSQQNLTIESWRVLIALAVFFDGTLTMYRLVCATHVSPKPTKAPSATLDVTHETYKCGAIGWHLQPRAHGSINRDRRLHPGPKVAVWLERLVGIGTGVCHFQGVRWDATSIGSNNIPQHKPLM